MASHPLDCLQSVRILIVDDTPINSWVAANVLQHHAAICETMSSGLEALDRLKQDALPLVDLVLLDLHMPDMHGFEVARSIRDIPSLKALPLIAYTTNVFGDTEAKARHAGMNDVIFKPAAPEQMIATCLKHLRTG